ncbi:glycosyltransferase [Nocardioides guangzhouensis]|uniref:Beta-monoglucosyldiacylglycerol synthase n=1 Tax=Nocardioides guangzhouensis TaxID=2497878 RepID=A0A4Q4ZLX2_9ACTN|nr:glycosyltransferase [Nocardioides guangzhouensis]RYP88945.1 glycosyltransferase [Nocardioides guangzhouensis]
MADFLGVVLVTSATLALLATATLFVGSGRALWLPPMVRGTVAACAVGLVGLGVAAAWGLGPTAGAGVAGWLTASILVWAHVARDWTARGLVAWATTVGAGATYLLWVGAWTVGSSLTPVERTGSVLLWLLEAFVFVLALGHVWELVDVLARRRWTRRVAPTGDAPYRPFVSLHVPTHNEPPDLVIETLESLLALRYDDYEVLVLDNNTTDERLWRPVEEFCRGHERLRFFHLEDWPGYKSGALNFGLERTDARAELVGVVDADYQAEPDFLERCAPLFEDATLGFLQTPQDYRSWEFSGYFRRLYHSYKYFFDVSQVSRNERGAPIFGGTMGLIRRRALVASGGWDEWCITEDAELSLRLLRDGWTGRHVDESFGHGIMPLSFEALKRQRFRWCFGGVQILRMHWRSLLPGRVSDRNRMATSQRWAFLVGGLQWFGDVAALAFTLFLAVGAVDLAAGDGLVVRRLGPLLLLCTITLVGLGAVRSVALLHRVGHTTRRDALGAFGIWLALGWSVALGALRGLTAREGAFLRTPKVREDHGLRDVVWANRVETALALGCVGVAAWVLARPSWAAVSVASLLVFQAAGYAAAPLNSLAALRSWLPQDLRRRRREGLQGWSRRAQPVRRGGVLVAATMLATGAFVVLAAPSGGPLPDPPRDFAGPGHGADPTSDGEPGGTSTRTTDGATTPVPPSVARTTGPGPTSSAAAPRTSSPAPATTRPGTTPPTSAAPSPSGTTGGPTTRPSPRGTPRSTPTRPDAAASPTRKP